MHLFSCAIFFGNQFTIQYHDAYIYMVICNSCYSACYHMLG